MPVAEEAVTHIDKALEKLIGRSLMSSLEVCDTLLDLRQLITEYENTSHEN